ncbi:MAG: NAD(P)/FAD-dependent oxidoreductase [Nocardioides sp.]
MSVRDSGRPMFGRRSARAERRIAVIGAGPAGIAAGRELLRQGFTGLTIIDAQDGPGGTWRLHTYPGLACDVWAHSYTFTYAPNPDWSANYAPQPEILAYLERCAAEFGLTPHLLLDTRVVAARLQDDLTWRLCTDRGEELTFDVVINAMGNQHTPVYPDVPGLDSFTGTSFHGTRWDHDVDLRGKRVAVVGSAASAVQIVPEVAKQAAHLTVLQRSPNWIAPRRLKTFTDAQRRRWRRFPVLISAIRRVQSLALGQVEHAVTIGHPRMGQFEKMVTSQLDKTIDDPELRAALTPDTRFGCKRGLVSDDFYPTLNQDHVELIPSGLEQVTPTGLVTADGREVDVDVIIYCTGYRILDFDRIEVTGEDGRSLADDMARAPQAHKGIAVPGFPNYFLAVGPNGVVLNVSYFWSVEQNVATIVRLLGDLSDLGCTAMSPRPELCERYNESLSDKFSAFSWGASDCHSYYRTASGHAPFLFPGNFKQWRGIQSEITLAEFELT